ncbi:unnamed protein product [Prunus armeniaca]
MPKSVVKELHSIFLQSIGGERVIGRKEFTGDGGNFYAAQRSLADWTGWSGTMRKKVATQYEVDIGLLVQFEIVKRESWVHLTATLRTSG